MAREEDDREVLELRVHGVNNTPPAAMLDLPPDQIEEVSGDELAGFWRPKVAGGPEARDLRGHVPPGITREAYSWGGLARMSNGGGAGTAGKIIAGLTTAGWTLLLPFGLANIAYWSRRLDGRRLPKSQAPEHPLAEAGAAVVRLFGLLLTALLVVTVCEISMDLVASQCFRDDVVTSDKPRMVCTRLPGFLDGLAPLDLATRLAVFSAVPIALLIGLWWLSSTSRSRYERSVSSKIDPNVTAVDGDSPADYTDPHKPILARSDMWRGDAMVGGLAQVHLSAGFALIALCLMWPALFGSGNSCSTPKSLLGASCRAQVQHLGSAGILYGGCLVMAVVVLGACVFLTRWVTDTPDVTTRETKRKGRSGTEDIAGRARRARGILLILSLLVFAGAELVLLIADPEIEVRINLLGVSALPSVLLVLMLGLVTWAMFLRLSGHGGLWAVLLVASLGWLVATDWGTLAVAVVLVGIVIHLSLVHDQGERRWQGWAGMGPGIFLGAGLWVQVFISSGLVLMAGDWLNGSRGAGTLIPKPRATSTKALRFDECGNLCSGQDPILTAPLPYLLVGAAALLAAIVLVGGLLIAWLRSKPEPPTSPLPTVLVERVLAARRFARVAHRAERLVGLLVMTAVSLVLVVVMSAVGGWLETDRSGTPSGWLRPLDFSTPAVALLAAAGLAALVKGSSNGKKRPLGLLWDLIAFLPRAAHPFAPPCYAERAVPELTDRVAWWLDRDHPVEGAQRRRGSTVVISAHSLGGVLTIAALMQDSMWAHERNHSIRLLTYGSQLRAYFARLFPELLGPSILGTPPSRAALLLAHDPWQDEKDLDEGYPFALDIPRSEGDYQVPDSWSITHRLSDPEEGILWRNLWRRTDYLGFPVWSFLGSVDAPPGAQPRNPIDIPSTEEVDSTGYLLKVLTHSNYPRTASYASALMDLADLPEEADHTTGR